MQTAGTRPGGEAARPVQDAAIQPGGPRARTHGCRCNQRVNRSGHGAGVNEWVTLEPGVSVTAGELLAGVPGRVYVVSFACRLHNTTQKDDTDHG